MLNNIDVTGTLENGDPFAGTLDITQITRDGSTLLFDGALTNEALGSSSSSPTSLAFSSRRARAARS